MEILFWLLLALLAWCYVGYPLGMLLRARLRPRRWTPGAPIGQPVVSAVVAVRNGADFIQRRLDDLFAADYPADLLEVIVVCNGCTDDSETLARERARQDVRVRVLVTPAEGGKSAALNAGVAAAVGEYVVLTDVRQVFDGGAIAHLLEPFTDRQVGAVSGRLVLGRGTDAAVEGLRWYWTLETMLRKAESETGSIVGATGAIYAIRASAFESFPPSLILDDVYLPMHIAMRGARVVLADRALAFDSASVDDRTEYYRKRRTMVGNIQLLRAMPRLLSPTRNPMFVRFLSHKVLRLGTPAYCVGIVALAGLLSGPVYTVAFWSGILVYTAGFLGLLVRSRVLAGPAAFLLMHLAILSALVRFRQDADRVWQTSGARADP